MGRRLVGGWFNNGTCKLCLCRVAPELAFCTLCVALIKLRGRWVVVGRSVNFQTLPS